MEPIKLRVVRILQAVLSKEEFLRFQRFLDSDLDGEFYLAISKEAAKMAPESFVDTD